MLSDERIGDLLDLDKEYEYTCSDGSFKSTIDCRPVAQAQEQATRDECEEDKKKAIREIFDKLDKCSPPRNIIVLTRERYQQLKQRYGID